MESNLDLKLGSRNLSNFVRRSFNERYGAKIVKIKIAHAIERSVIPFVVLTFVCCNKIHIEMLVARNVYIMARKIELNISLFEMILTSFCMIEQHFGSTYLRHTRSSPMMIPTRVRAAIS